MNENRIAASPVSDTRPPVRPRPKLGLLLTLALSVVAAVSMFATAIVDQLDEVTNLTTAAIIAEFAASAVGLIVAMVMLHRLYTREVQPDWLVAAVPFLLSGAVAGWSAGDIVQMDGGSDGIGTGVAILVGLPVAVISLSIGIALAGRIFDKAKTQDVHPG